MNIAVYYYVKFSGAKRVVMEHVKGLTKLGNNVDIYTIDQSNDIFNPGAFSRKNYLYSYKTKDINIPILNRIIKDYYYTFIKLRLIHRKIANDIDKKKYDIVLVHTDINTQSPFLLRYLKSKNVYFCLEPLRNAYEYSLRLKKKVNILNKIYETLNRAIRKKIDMFNTLSARNIITISLFARERIIAAYDLYPEISYLGVDERIFKPLHINKKNQIFFVAEKYPIYGYDLALEAIKQIPKKNRPELKIVSWKKNNGERLSDEELVKIYNESLVTLSLSRFDTFGLVPLESMACGTPVIALNVAGYRETIKNNETGFLVDFNSKEIAEKILYFMQNKEKSTEFGVRGRKWIEEKWTWNSQLINLNKQLSKFSNNNG
jgi:glycosyltransferase involved in cell wall biosynthesis